jgi:hypothetical protein
MIIRNRTALRSLPIAPALAALALTLGLSAQDKVTVFRGAQVHPVAAAPIQNGVVVVGEPERLPCDGDRVHWSPSRNRNASSHFKGRARLAA